MSIWDEQRQFGGHKQHAHPTWLQRIDRQRRLVVIPARIDTVAFAGYLGIRSSRYRRTPHDPAAIPESQ